MKTMAYEYDEYDDYRFEGHEPYEIIEGEKFIMAPAPNLTHGTIVNRLIIIFANYIEKNNINAAVFHDNTDVHIDAENWFMPDVSVVCNPAIADRNGSIHGTPDLVVEILSRSTMKRDISTKKSVYERSGVKEYWIINPWAKSIEVYHLVDGKFILDDVYQIYSEADLKLLTDDERAAIKYDIKISIFDDLLVDIRKVFKWWFD